MSRASLTIEPLARPAAALPSPLLLIGAGLLALLTPACANPQGSNGKAPSVGEQESDADADTDADADADTDTDTGEPAEPDPLDLDEDGDGYTPRGGDCDDSDPALNPGALELCDGIDNNCDGFSDADFDDDGDGVADCEDNCPVQVNIAAPAGGDGTWDRPYRSIQEGIDEAWARACPRVEVSDGTYMENVVYDGALVYVVSHYGPEATIIDGGGVGTVVSFTAGEDAQAVLDGFTITNGAAALGAGLFIQNASPIIRGNIITDNLVTTDGGGGGIGLRDASPLIEDNEISANDAGYGGPESGNDGGGINIRGGAPIIVDNHIVDNTAGDGGGIWLVRSDALIYHNIIDGNLAYDSDPVQAGQGGGVDVQIGTVGLVFTNNVVTNNFASSHGGGIAVYEYSSASGSPTITHNVVAYNDAPSTAVGGGLLAFGATVPVFLNNLVYGNTPSGIHLTSGASARYNLVFGNAADWAGAQGSRAGLDGNLAADPLLSVSDDGDFTDDDWRPASGSPLLDAGDPSAALDPDGSRADIGAWGGAYGAW